MIFPTSQSYRQKVTETCNLSPYYFGYREISSGKVIPILKNKAGLVQLQMCEMAKQKCNGEKNNRNFLPLSPCLKTETAKF
jgi:hypothetical protein